MARSTKPDVHPYKAARDAERAKCENKGIARTVLLDWIEEQLVTHGKEEARQCQRPFSPEYREVMGKINLLIKLRSELVRQNGPLGLRKAITIISLTDKETIT
jgi:hypothetical protein